MYEDAWYSFVPETHSKRENVVPQVPQHRRRESLLQQTNGNNQMLDQNSPLLGIYEDEPSSKDPPKATLARRAKSYSDFYEVAMAFINKEADDGKTQSERDFEAGGPKIPLFEERYSALEEDLVDGSLEEYQLYLDQLILSERHLNNLLSDTSSALDTLATLSESFKNVEAQTTAFQAQCEDLLEEQKRIRELADEIGTDLQYYAYLEPLTRRLNAPGAGRLVKNGDFLEMLENLNSCIEFMDQHPNYKDSTVYKTRYTTLLDKALNLVQVAFSNALREVSDDASKQLKAKEQTETNQYILLYGKYESAKESLGLPIERLLATEEFAFGRRGDVDRTPYIQQWHNLYQQLLEAYIRSRDPVGPLVLKNLQKFATTSPLPDKEFELFARRCVQYIFDTCQNELKLAAKFFQDGPLMADYPPPPNSWNMPSVYLEKLEESCLSYVKTLNGFLAPYLSNGDLHRVCDLVTWLGDTFISAEAHEDESRDGQRLAAQVLLSVHLWPLADQLFIMEARKLELFKSSPEDLKIISSNAPKLSNEKVIPTSGLRIDTTLNAPEEGTSVEAGVSNAFPTVKTAVSLLVLYNESMHERTLKKGDVLYEIVHQTTESLQRAATVIKRTSNSIMDAQLFLIKNLMLIENLFMTHEIPDSIRQSAELDFTPLWETLKELQSRHQVFNPLAYIRPIIKGQLLPAVVDKVLDARKELEKVLVQQITAFTKHWQSRLSEKDPKKRDQVAKVTQELDVLLESVFDEETTRAALLRMIKGGEDY
ncbi:7fd2c57f-2761-4e4f-ab43-2063ec9cd323 [Sclerotinia trifoliorum]|uniref:Conserved oligomeric Golgi complex subunit 3 n=1 Tax=Sclerotinia trifoliorum TaxID=28548 RepID=A0A8H2W742_9HELO|nr:7fd2c57f-2761-4e4f-ab43-2063ec9cd323 [Sclerotinia trifoliorum]